MSEKKYKDSNDNDRTLYEMLNCEPQWVINRFQFMEELLFATKSSESVEISQQLKDQRELCWAAAWGVINGKIRLELEIKLSKAIQNAEEPDF